MRLTFNSFIVVIFGFERVMQSPISGLAKTLFWRSELLIWLVGGRLSVGWVVRSVWLMFNAINAQCDWCSMWSMFDWFGIWRSSRHCKCGGSSDFLNEDCLIVGAADSASWAHNCKLCSAKNCMSDLIVNLWKSSGINTWGSGIQ